MLKNKNGIALLLKGSKFISSEESVAPGGAEESVMSNINVTDTVAFAAAFAPHKSAIGAAFVSALESGAEIKVTKKGKALKLTQPVVTQEESVVGVKEDLLPESVIAEAVAEMLSAPVAKKAKKSEKARLAKRPRMVVREIEEVDPANLPVFVISNIEASKKVEVPDVLPEEKENLVIKKDVKIALEVIADAFIRFECPAPEPLEGVTLGGKLILGWSEDTNVPGFIRVITEDGASKKLDGFVGKKSKADDVQIHLQKGEDQSLVMVTQDKYQEILRTQRSVPSVQTPPQPEKVVVPVETIHVDLVRKEKVMKKFTRIVKIEVVNPLPIDIGDVDGINLVPIDADLTGTVLDPKADVIVYRGVEYPAPGKFSGFRMKEGFKTVGKGHQSIGMVYDLEDLYAKINHDLVTRARKTKREDEQIDLKKIALSRLDLVLEKYVLNQHKGAVIFAVSLGDRRLGMNTLGLPIPLQKMIEEQNGGKCMHGEIVLRERYPLAEAACSGLYVVQYINSMHKAEFTSPARQKAAGGDYDGDKGANSPRTSEYVAIGVNVKDLPVLEAQGLDSCQVDLFTPEKHVWIESKQLAMGLYTGKRLQGPVANACVGLAVVANDLRYRDEKFRAYLESRGIDFSVSGIKVVKQITAMLLSGTAVYTEIGQDWRKSADGSDEKYEAQFWNFLAVYSGKKSQLNKLIAEKVDKEGRKIDWDLINRTMDAVLRSGADNLAVYLDSRPIIKSTVSKRKIDGRGIAEALVKHGDQYLLDVINGLRPEEMDYMPMSQSSTMRSRLKTDEEIVMIPAYRVPGTKEEVFNGWHAVEDVLKVIAPEDMKFNLMLDQGRVKMFVSLLNKDGVRISEKVDFGRTELSVHSSKSHIIVRRNAADKRSAFAVVSLTQNISKESLQVVTIHYLLAKALIHGAKKAMAGTGIKSFCSTAVERVFDSCSLYMPQGEIPIQGLEAQVITPERLEEILDKDYFSDRSYLDSYNQAKTLTDLLAEANLDHPIYEGVTLSFEVGLTSKSNPGETVAYKSKNGHPLLALGAVPVVDNLERLFRECRTLRTAKVPKKNRHFYNRSVVTPITARQMDGVFVLIDGLGQMFNKADDDGEMGYFTDFGAKYLAVEDEETKFCSVPVHEADRIAAQILGKEDAVYQHLEEIGWDSKVSYRKIGRQGGENVSEQLVTLIAGKEARDRTVIKLWTQGHKFMSMLISGEFTVDIHGTQVPVCGFMATQSLLRKKLDASVCLFYDGLVNGRQDFDMGVSAYDQIESLPEKHDIYKDGVKIGQGIPGMYPVYILNEDEEIMTSAKENGCPASAMRARLIGEPVTISSKTLAEISLLAAAGTGSEAPELPDVEVTDDGAPEETVSEEEVIEESSDIEEEYVDGYFDDIMVEEVKVDTKKNDVLSKLMSFFSK